MDVRQLKSEAEVLTAEEAQNLLQEAIKVLKRERDEGGYPGEKIKGGLVELSPEGKVIVVGDLHGDLDSLTTILKQSGFLKRVGEEKIYLVFLGDYGDRGQKTPEVYWVILRLKTALPHNVILLRGNHEPPEWLMPYPHDFPSHLRWRFSNEWIKIYRLFMKAFQLMPHVAYSEGSYFFVHGGVPTNALYIDELRNPSNKVLEDLLWNDPIDEEGIAPSWRGAGHFFGIDITKRFLQANNLKIVIRGHEPCNGYQLRQGGLVLTLFSRLGEPYYNLTASTVKIKNLKSYSGVGDLEFISISI